MIGRGNDEVWLSNNGSHDGKAKEKRKSEGKRGEEWIKLGGTVIVI